MSSRTRGLGLLLFALAAWGPAGAPGGQDQHNGPDVERVVAQIVRSTNEFRKQEGRVPVEVDRELAATAQYFAGFMAADDKYGHDADGQQPAERAKKHGYDYCIVAENIAWQAKATAFTTEELAGGFFTGWRKSPPHRKNMLDPDVTQLAVAVARSDKTGKYYAVQLFGRPRSQAIEFQLMNRTERPVEYTLGEKPYTLPPGNTRIHEECRPPELTVRPAAEAAKPLSARPRGGESYAVTEKAGELRLEKE